MNSGPNHQGGWPNPWGSAGGPIEQWAAAARAWAEMWMAFVPAMRSGPWPNPWQQPFPGGAAGFSGSGVPPPVSVRVASRRQTEVEASLTASAQYGSLVADIPGLSGLSITREPSRVIVTLEVGDEQPSGHFHGCIRAGGREVGHLAVTIREPEPSRQGYGESARKDH